MYATYHSISPEQLERMLSDPTAANDFFERDLYGGGNIEQYAEDEEKRRASGEFFSLEKEWHALHYLLTGDASLDWPCATAAPLANVVRGGTVVPLNTGASGYLSPELALSSSSDGSELGAVRYLTPGEVRAAAEALREISTDEMNRRIDAAAAASPDIYSHAGREGWNEDEREILLEYFDMLVAFFTKAAGAGKGMLMTIQ
jgi:hypothetical protein